MLCHYLGCIENGQDCGAELPGDAGVGTFGGSEDHTAIMCAAPRRAPAAPPPRRPAAPPPPRPAASPPPRAASPPHLPCISTRCCTAGQLAQYSFCPTRLERAVPFPPSLVLVLAVSGATAHKGSDKLQDYNNAALLARWAAAAAAAGAPPPDDADAADAPPTFAAVVRAAAARAGTEPSADAARAAVLASLAAADDGATYGPAGRASGDGATCFAAGALAKRFEQFHAESEARRPRPSLRGLSLTSPL